jgi:hypothetical protein
MQVSQILLLFILIPLFVGCGGSSEIPLPDRAVTFGPSTGIDFGCEETCPLTGYSLSGNELQSVTFRSDLPSQVGFTLRFPSLVAGRTADLSFALVSPAGVKTGTELAFNVASENFASISIRDFKQDSEDPENQWSTIGSSGAFSPGTVQVTYRDEHQIRLKLVGVKLLFQTDFYSNIDLDGATIVINLDLLPPATPI